jgi:Alpha/beta hydrolase family
MTSGRPARLRGVSTYLLIPGAGGTATWFYQRVTPLLQAAGHAAVPVDLPGPDPVKGLPEYVDLIAAAAEGHDDVVLVAQSMGAFCAVPACERVAPRALVLLNAMVPAPGETAGDWWEATGSEAARVAAAQAGGYGEAFDLDTYFLHDVPPEVYATGAEQDHDEANIAFEQPCPFAVWPAVETTVLAGEGDRLFPFAFQRRVARERLGVEAVGIAGGHLAALSEPRAVADAILAATAQSYRPANSSAYSS